MLHNNPDLMAQASRACSSNDATILGQYAVIGKPDFLTMVEADDNEAIARLSLEIGVQAGLHIETLPAIAIGFLAEPGPPDREGEAEEANVPVNERILLTHDSLPPVADVYGRRRE